jgi:hypothetical protein
VIKRGRHNVCIVRKTRRHSLRCNGSPVIRIDPLAHLGGIGFELFECSRMEQ